MSDDVQKLDAAAQAAADALKKAAQPLSKEDIERIVKSTEGK